MAPSRSQGRVFGASLVFGMSPGRYGIVLGPYTDGAVENHDGPNAIRSGFVEIVYTSGSVLVGMYAL